MIEYLNTIDTKLFLFLNGQHNAFFDPIMFWLSNIPIWVPMYLLIIFLMIRRYKMRGFLMLLLIGIAIALCDQTSSHLLKNLIQRLRPSHEPALAGLIHLSKAGPGGLYGFVSSHAANCFGLATFIYFTFDNRFKPLKYLLIVWAVLVSYSRIYNGVHYPGDVIGGAIIGITIGWAIAALYKYVDSKRLKTS
jgi:undecaprenyl-diphosphatase